MSAQCVVSDGLAALNPPWGAIRAEHDVAADSIDSGSRRRWPATRPRSLLSNGFLRLPNGLRPTCPVTLSESDTLTDVGVPYGIP